jgi:putative alpha-1,2-mannosidase
MSNEPDIANPFLFNYVKGEEWRTQKTVREVLHSNFSNTRIGLSGDDDCGTMSTWVVLAMAGFYPDCPGSNKYALFSPVFKKVTIKLNPKFYPGKEFIIDTEHNAPDNVYINAMQLNGVKYESYFLNHEDVIKGGTLKLELGHEH